MNACPKCWAHVSTPLFCESCQSLLEPAARPTPFQALGLEPVYGLDEMALRKRLLALSRRMHPDFHRSDPRAHALAERNIAEVNAAHEVLADQARRAEWLVASLGGPSEQDERKMPVEFLGEVLEWNEGIEAAAATPPGSEERASLRRLGQALRERRRALVDEVGRDMEPLPAVGAPILRSVRQRLNAVRYFDRALARVDELENASPAPR